MGKFICDSHEIACFLVYVLVKKKKKSTSKTDR